MKGIKMTAQEREQMLQWVSDESWIKQKRYLNDSEYLHCVQDILDHEVFKSMDQYIQHGETSCMKHCIQVSYLSYRICKKMGWEYQAAARAGLLHDLFLYDWHTHGKETGERFHGFTHPRKALNNASAHFKLTKKEKNMILRHMWPLTPIPPKSVEGLALVYADKFCSSVEIIGHMKNRILIKAGIHHGILGKVS